LPTVSGPEYAAITEGEDLLGVCPVNLAVAAITPGDILPDWSATSARRAVVLKAAEKDAWVGWVLGKEVGAEARQFVVPAGEHISLTGITIQENAPVTAYPQRIGITGGMHEDMHVSMGASANRIAPHMVARTAGLHAASPYGGWNWIT